MTDNKALIAELDEASEIARHLRCCVTASGGIDLRDPKLLLAAALALETMQEQLNIAMVALQKIAKISEKR